MSTPESPGERASSAFRTCFGKAPELLSSAPGRVNLIGEHTDYNDGFVFPVAINFHTAVAGAKREDRLIDVLACDEGNQRVQFEIDAEPEFDNDARWSNYLRGLVVELNRAGYDLTGADLTISGNVPLGAGLSSSAALEMAVITSLTRLAGTEIEATHAAQLGQAAENNFVGCQCGIMDQLISARGQAGHAVLLDCRSLAMQPVPLPDQLALVVINSNTRRALVDGEYNQRRKQCEEAANHFSVAALRDLTKEQLVKRRDELDPTVFRRARHVITENQRTLDMADALRSMDLAAIGRLMAESHESMRRDFAITTPQIDGLVDIVKSEVGDEGGVRMTGGGFGGCVVALVPNHKVKDVLAMVQADYPAIAGHDATAFVCEASDGAFT